MTGLLSTAFLVAYMVARRCSAGSASGGRAGC